MKKLMEKVSILSLSLILTTAFSISSAQSAMFAFYKGIPESWVELLVSLPSAGIMLMLLFNRVIEKYLTERQMIVSGLLIFSLCGLLPLLNQSYWLMFASRLVFGMGIGLLNAKAIMEAAGLSLNDVVKTTVLLADIADFAEMNEVYAEFFSEPYPARSAFAVKSVPKGALVEIECIAAKKI